jgi:hypothetical protein
MCQALLLLERLLEPTGSSCEMLLGTELDVTRVPRELFQPPQLALHDFRAADELGGLIPRFRHARSITMPALCWHAFAGVARDA